jgi:hypothetical protein
VIKVVDKTAPVIKLKGESFVLVTRWDEYNEPGYTISDNYYDVSELKVDSFSNVDMLRPGVYQVCYWAKDPSKNKTPEICRTVQVMNPSTTSIEDGDGEEIGIYPNPTTGLLNIELGRLSADASVVITNLLGETVYEMRGETIQKTTVRVDMSSYSDGVYMVRVQTGNTTK